MTIKRDLKLWRLGFTNEVNRLYKSVDGYILIDFCRQVNCKCNFCNKGIPPSIKRWSFGHTPASHVCPDCLDKVSQITESKQINESSLKDLKLEKKSQKRYSTKAKSAGLDSRKNMTCKICHKDNIDNSIYFRIFDQKVYCEDFKRYIYICPSCIKMLANESHMEDYKQQQQDWMLKRIAKKI